MSGRIGPAPALAPSDPGALRHETSMRSDLKDRDRYQIEPPLVCHLSQHYLSSGATNLYFHRDHYTLPQSYNTTSESIEREKNYVYFEQHSYL